MSVNLKLKNFEVVQRSFKISREVSIQLDEYVHAAQETVKTATPDMVIEALILKQTKSDQAFKRWKKARAKQIAEITEIIEPDGDGIQGF